MTLIAEYKGEIFVIALERGDQVLLSTLIRSKAEKVGMPHVDKGVFEKWMSRRDIRILGDHKNLGLEHKLI